MTVLDGKKTSNDIKNEITEKVKLLKKNGYRAPHLAAVIVGNDGASLTYVGSKVRACERIGFESTPTRMHVQKFKFIEPFKAVSLILSPPAGTGGMDLLVSIQNCTTSTGTLLQVMQQSEHWRHTQILSNRIQVDFTVKRWISMHLSNDNTSKMVFERTVFHSMTDERCFLNAIIVTFIVLSHGSYLRSVILKLLFSPSINLMLFKSMYKDTSSSLYLAALSLCR